MAKRMPLSIAGQVFRTKQDAAAKIREIVSRYNPGTNLNDADFQFMLAVLQRHPSVEEKVGVGVASMQTQRTAWGNIGLVLTRTDGTSTDFSWTHCLNPKSPVADFLQACRHEIAWQIKRFKDESFSSQFVIECPITGEQVSRDKCHVDHAAPRTFEFLVQQFIQLENICPELVLIEGFADGEMEKRIADRELAGRWLRFHESNAILRIVSRQANLSVLRRKSAATNTE